jgi:hypothetical protein
MKSIMEGCSCSIRNEIVSGAVGHRRAVPTEGARRIGRAHVGARKNWILRLLGKSARSGSSGRHDAPINLRSKV